MRLQAAHLFHLGPERLGDAQVLVEHDHVHLRAGGAAVTFMERLLCPPCSEPSNSPAIQDCDYPHFTGEEAEAQRGLCTPYTAELSGKPSNPPRVYVYGHTCACGCVCMHRCVHCGHARTHVCFHVRIYASVFLVRECFNLFLAHRRLSSMITRICLVYKGPLNLQSTFHCVKVKPPPGSQGEPE